jgi:hypothetical protein
MANSIGPGGNYFERIANQQAKGVDSKTAENLRQTGGTAASQRKSHTSKNKGVPQEEGGLQLSDAAQKSLQANHQEHIQGHEHELAQQAGLQETDSESNESHELRMKRGHEREQEEMAQEAANGGGQLPEGYAVITSPGGVEQVLAPDQITALDSLDRDLDHVDQKVLGDIPDANLEAAGRVVDTQLKDGLNKVAKLKPVPEAEAAGRMQLEAADFVSGPLDIREPGNDKLTPMTLDFPDEMTEMLKEQAARDLANGVAPQEENLLA